MYSIKTQFDKATAYSKMTRFSIPEKSVIECRWLEHMEIAGINEVNVCHNLLRE
jgi:hypothetical protein